MKNKNVFKTIIVLLIIFIPLTIWSYILKDKNIGSNNDNPKHFPYYQSALWFYDNDNLIGKYNCSFDRCSYKLGNTKYTIIRDGDNYFLYDIRNEKVLEEYDNANNIIDNDYIVTSNNLKGVVRVGDETKVVIPLNYEEVKLSSNLKDNYLVKKDNVWFIVDSENNKISNNFNLEIIDFNNNYIICESNERIRIFSYEGREYLNNLFIKEVNLTLNSLSAINNTYLYIYSDVNNSPLKVYNYKDTLKVVEEDNLIKVYDSDTLLDTLAIS